MKIENANKSNLVYNGVVETARKNLKEAATIPDETKERAVDKKIFKNPEPSSLKGFKIDKLA